MRASLSESDDGARLSVKDITQWFVDRFSEECDTKVTTKWIGSVIRRKLLIRTQKSHGVFVIPTSERPKLAPLYERYGIGDTDTAPGSSGVDPGAGDPTEERRVDVGDLGDMAAG